MEGGSDPARLEVLYRRKATRRQLGSLASSIISGPALVEGDVQFAFLDPLVEPGAAEDEPAQPVDETLVAGSGQVLPVMGDVDAQFRARLLDLAGNGQMEQVIELGEGQAGSHETEPHCGLFDSLAEVPFVEREPEIAVLEHIVSARLVVSSAGLFTFHG